MLDQLKSTLLEIRKDREAEFLKVAPSYVDETEKKKQQAILLLELPFSAKHSDIFYNRGKLHKQAEQKAIKKRKKKAYRVVQEWVHSGSEENIHTHQQFCDFLLQQNLLFYHWYHIDSKYTARPVTSEELSKKLSYQSIADYIDTLKRKDSANLKSLLEDLISFINKDLYVTRPMIFKKKSPLSLFKLADLFDILETRALKSTTVRAYSDILIARSLVYAPLPAKKLFSLPPPQKTQKGWVLTCDNRSFPVPESFVKLSQKLSSETKLLPKELSEDLLSKKIRNLGRYVELPITLNPSVLMLSMESVLSELNLSLEMSQTLPTR